MSKVGSCNQSTDIFTLGVLLLSMITGGADYFETPTADNAYYRYIFHHRQDLLWKKIIPSASDSLKMLLTLLL